jgi:hypothetical protein
METEVKSTILLRFSQNWPCYFAQQRSTAKFDHNIRPQLTIFKIRPPKKLRPPVLGKGITECQNHTRLFLAKPILVKLIVQEWIKISL